jgi:Uma2 family endonuclease
MTVAQTKERIYTLEEYLELEIASETRSEYRNGEIIPMTGGTPNHNDLASNLLVSIKNGVKRKALSCIYRRSKIVDSSG